MKLVFIITRTTVGGAQIMLHRVLTRLSPEFKPHVISMNLVLMSGFDVVLRRKG